MLSVTYVFTTSKHVQLRTPTVGSTVMGELTKASKDWEARHPPHRTTNIS
jgi:hypothetical protein